MTVEKKISECLSFERVGGATQGCGRQTVPGTERCKRHTDVMALIRRAEEAESQVKTLREALLSRGCELREDKYDGWTACAVEMPLNKSGWCYACAVLDSVK